MPLLASVTAETPQGSPWQQPDAAKKGVPMERTAIVEKLGQAFLIESPEFGKDTKESLGLAGKEETVPPFVIVDAIHTATVIQEDAPALAAVDQQAAEGPVQVSEEPIASLFV